MKKAPRDSPWLVADVHHRGRSGDGPLSHSSFKGLLEGVDPAEVSRPT